ncbi:RteC domain-containing protein [uncultured Sphingobacterium sp.]|uniref:RteC domain-containing protein n=1 Tax=uncultured Sphingobacterium sp. TaxID=182688 RepID=UPI00374A0F4E
MNNYCAEVIDKLNEQLEELSIELDNSIHLYEIAISLILERMNDIKQFILKRGFTSEEEEILFFKKLKPSILSKLIYYNTIYKIEMKKPHGGEKNIRKYLNHELSKLRRYFDNNLEFYKYYRTASTYLDQTYFVRDKYDIKLSLDTYYFEADHSFSTSHDYKVAKIIANDLIQVYIEDQLSNDLKKKSQVVLNWTANKTSLIELIYALHSQGVFDNGTSDIKLIAKSFESLFNIDLGDFYHTYMELKNRKINRTKFIDALKDSLIHKMDEQDEK